MGTDGFGQDIASRCWSVPAAVCWSAWWRSGGALLGVPLGVTAAVNQHSWLGTVIMRATDIVYAFPALLLAIILLRRAVRSTVTAMTAIGIASIPAFARVSRGAALQVLSQDYIIAARSAGTTRWHRLAACAAEHHSGGARPGLGQFRAGDPRRGGTELSGPRHPADHADLGTNDLRIQPYLYTNLNLALWPGLFIAIAVLGFNLLGDGLRELVDPTLQDVR